MQYRIKKLDGRYAHNAHFDCCIDFPRNQLGPADFHQVMEWMIDTYGYSAEVRDFMQIKNMLQKRLQFNVPDSNNPKCVNPVSYYDPLMGHFSCKKLNSLSLLR